MKGLKGDGVKHSQAKGALAAAETVPLFPRLHVNETEKAGPKAPPRNKMALYEQFTVPSHRFVQANQASATIMCQKNQVQYGPHDYRYSYLPYYMPPVPYASCNSGIQAYALPSHTASTSGTSAGSGVLSDEGQQKVVKNHPTVSPSKGSRRMTEAAADSLTRVLPGQKGKDAGNSHMPRSSFCRNTKKQTSKLSQSVPSCIQKSSTVITDSTQEPLSSVELGLKRIVPDGLLCIEELAESRKVHMTAEGQPKEASRQSDTNMLDERHEQSSSGHSCLQIECGSGSICQDLSAPSDALANVISGNGICTTNKGFYHHVQLSEGQAVIDGQTSLANGHPSDGVQGDGMGCPIGKAFSEPECARAEGWSMAECQMSQPRMKEGRSNESSVSDATCEIKPKVVIHAIGQQQFWKARKALLRQQRIFSDQVFQLHKLRKVQQLLAESPAGTLIDEKMHFETIEKCDAAASAPAKNITHLGARAHKATCDPKDGRKDKALEGAIQPHGTIQGHGGIQAGGKDCGRVQQSVQELGGGSGVSAWGYPSLGPWVGPMGGQGQPFVCEPFAGTLPPGLGSAFGLPYGTAMRGSIPPMISVGIPYYDQMQALAIEMGSNYTLYKQAGGSSGDSSGRDSSHMMSNDLSGSWHVMQHNSLNRQRVHAAGPNKDIPTGSGASVNKSPAAVGSVKTPYFPAAWVSTGQAGVVNTDGLESSGHQSETSSPSVATKHHGSGVYIPAASRQLGFNHSDRGDGIHTGHLASAYMSDNGDQYVCCTNATEIGEVDPGTQGDVIGQKAADIALDVGSLEDNEEVSGHTVNIHALELFPLVPSLSSSGLGHSRKEALGGQGHVIRAVPRRAIAASESVAGILLSLRRERQKQVSC